MTETHRFFFFCCRSNEGKVIESGVGFGRFRVSEPPVAGPSRRKTFSGRHGPERQINAFYTSWAHLQSARLVKHDLATRSAWTAWEGSQAPIGSEILAFWYSKVATLNRVPWVTGHESRIKSKQLSLDTNPDTRGPGYQGNQAPRGGNRPPRCAHCAPSTPLRPPDRAVSGRLPLWGGIPVLLLPLGCPVASVQLVVVVPVPCRW